MNSNEERWLELLKNEKVQKFSVFVLYVSLIMIICVDLSSIIEIICHITAIISAFVIMTGKNDIIDMSNKKDIKQEIKKIAKELILFIPIFLLDIFVSNFLLKGTPTNDIEVRAILRMSPIYYSISIVILGPILEEVIYRYLPSKFIKNQFVYIIFSSIVFAGIHVIGYPNPLYNMLFYIMLPLYYGYRYCKTKDILVTISLHSFHNLIAVLIEILFYF